MQSIPTTKSSIFNACIIQPSLRSNNDESPIQATEAVIELMMNASSKGSQEETTTSLNKKSTNIDMFILPELCPIGYSEETFDENFSTSTTPSPNKEILRRIDQRMQQTAQTLNCAICYGTIGYSNDDDDNDKHQDQQQEEKYNIRQIVVDDTGTEIASYDKIHLCDYGDCAETRFFTPGQKIVSFRYKNWKFGLLICADMRYPILSQKMVQSPQHNVDVILQPACFARDISFRTWKSFRETRAVENGVYWLAVNYAGPQFGESSMVPPWVDEHHEPRVMDNEIGYLIVTLDRQILDYARTELPFHKHTVSTSCGSYN